MKYWQDQMNFAMWCATGGCGVSYNDHLEGAAGKKEPLIRSVYYIHVYYTIQRLLAELKCALPVNPFDGRAYERLCNEFGVHPNTDWGLGASWGTYVLEDSKGFTQADMERINNSIRTYVWALLAAQTQTKSRILDGFEAQKQFLALWRKRSAPRSTSSPPSPVIKTPCSTLAAR